ncbi:hypothetical protein ACLWBD_07720 [Bdellovibrio sp. HCB117]|uniref:hypothetical protein n=1 Tax=Bdellovibrio sp. HCB117 TaxID=3394359 RepID=UPI0039B50C23
MSYFRLKEDSLFKTMLGSVSLTVLRQVYKKATGIDVIPSDKNSTEGIQKLLQICGVPKENITELLLEAEAERPFRHLYLSRWTGDFKNITELALAQIGTAVDVADTLSIPNIICEHVAHTKEYISLTFSHDAKSTHWYSQDGGRFPETITIRHPIVVHLHQNNTVLVTYPGYSQDRTALVSYDYNDLVEKILIHLREKFTIDYRPYLIKKVVESLLKRQSSRVKFIRIKSRNDDGAMDFESKSNDISIETLLPSLMMPHLPNTVTEEQIKEALINAINDCDLKSSILYWNDEKIATKLSYYSLGMELYITWMKQRASYEILLPAINFLIFLSSKFETETSQLFEFFVSNRTNRVFTRSELAASVASAAQALDKELVALVSQRILETRYRLKTDHEILDYENVWVSDLRVLMREFQLFDHSAFDGRKPNNIEVGFWYPSVAREVAIGS